MTRILIGSSISQKPEILKEFLRSLKEIKKEKLEYNYFFIDDNRIEESCDILKEFSSSEDFVSILKNNTENNESNKYNEYICDETTHRWSTELVKKESEFKNFIIKKAIDENFDYLFLVDSDLLLHENTLKRLISLDKEIVSTIFWIKWYPNSEEEPQVWLKDNYTLYNSVYNENISSEE